ADELVSLDETNVERSMEMPFSMPNLNDVSKLTHSFGMIGAALGTGGTLDLGPDADAIEVDGSIVTGNYFATLGVAPYIGRWVSVEDAAPRAPAVVVLSYGLWKEHFGGNANIVGQSVRISGSPRTVIGVAPPSFAFPTGVSYWAACRSCTDPPESTRANISASVVARLAPGVTLEQAATDANHAAALIHRDHPNLTENQMTGIRVRSLKEAVIADTQKIVLLLSGSIAFVLLIGCANLVNANLARNTIRQHELTLRSALGASRARVIQLLLIESLTISLAGAALGVAGAWWGVRLVGRHASEFLPRIGELTLDTRAILFALLVALLIATFIGLIPALRLSGGNLRARMTERGASGQRHNTVRRFLVGFEIALAVVLLVGAGLSLRSLQAVLAQPMGIATRGVITFQPVMNARFRSQSGAVIFYDDLLARIRAVPGVTGAAGASAPPLGNQWTGFIEVEGKQGNGGSKDVAPSAGYNLVTEGFFETVGLTLLKGRLFSAADDSLHPHVTVVNKTMAAMYWPNEDPVGKRFRALSMDSRAQQWLTVVGVVSDLHYYSLEMEVSPIHYVSSRQRPDRLAASTVIVRSTSANSVVIPRIREALRAVDPTATAHVTTLDSRIDETTSTRRLMMNLLGVFAGVALLLAAIGVYGVLSYIVAQRTREIGVRMALGSSVQRIVRMMLGDIMKPVSLGLIAGLVASRMLSTVLQSLVFQLSTSDPLVLGATCAVLVGLAIVAAVIPARRAAHVDPLIALRGES
ncbi:MAG: ABC transporter permease, partial [Gemmatimonadaceae bacterium]